MATLKTLESPIGKRFTHLISSFVSQSGQGLSKAKMADAMNTSRSALDRLLDADNIAVTLKTLDRAAMVLGKRLQIEIVDASSCGDS